MYKVALVLVCSLAFLIAAGNAFAQADMPDCDLETVLQSATELLQQIDPSNTDNALGMIRTVSAQLIALDAACRGLSFQGDEQKVIGPVTIPEGIYRAHITISQGSATASVTILDGECGGGSGAFHAPAFFIGANNGAETVFTSRGCEVLIEVRSSSSWELLLSEVQRTSAVSALTANTSGVQLGEIVSARSVDRDGCPADITTQFAPDDAVYIVARESRVPSGTAVFVRLYMGNLAVEDTDEIVANQDFDSVCINFVFENSRGFDAGEYSAEFFVNGSSAGTVTFSVR